MHILFSVVTNAMFITACDFMNIELAGGFAGTFAFWKYKESGQSECTDLPDDFGDGWFRTAQLCTIIALCSGGILLVFGFFKQCIIPLPCSQLIMDLASTLTQVCLALVYLVWLSETCKEDYDCTWGDSGILLILTQVFWLAAGCFTRCMRPGRRERAKERD